VPAILVSGERRTGTYVYLETIGGGAGARLGADGAEAVQMHVTNSSNLPAEALEILEPELAQYRARRLEGAMGTRFVRSLVHALYVSAIAQPEDAAGQARRQAALAEAAEVLGALSTEARQTSDSRVLAEWLAAADGTVLSRLAP
jgi:hypothetical protein